MISTHYEGVADHPGPKVHGAPPQIGGIHLGNNRAERFNRSSVTKFLNFIKEIFGFFFLRNCVSISISLGTQYKKWKELISSDLSDWAQELTKLSALCLIIVCLTCWSCRGQHVHTQSQTPKTWEYYIQRRTPQRELCTANHGTDRKMLVSATWWSPDLWLVGPTDSEVSLHGHHHHTVHAAWESS